MHIQISPRITDAADGTRQKLRRARAYLVPVAIMSAVYMLGICAILRANFNYVDDMMRAFEGYKEWGDVFSRYLSAFLSNFIHADSYLTDVSPLPQLLACVLLGIASVIVLHVITGRDRFTFWEYAAVLPLGLSPYMLECLSFKFDAPYMAISVLASVAPLLWAKRPRALVIASFLGTMAMCFTYQAASGILPMFVVLLAVRMWLAGDRPRDVLRFIADAAVGYCAAILLFKVVFVKPTPAVHSYANTSVPELSQLVPHVIDVLQRYFSKILYEYDNKWLILAGLLGLGYVWVSVRDSKRNKFLALPLALACVAVMLLLSFGLYPLLTKPLIQARTMYGLGACLAFLAVSAAAGVKALPVKLVCFALSWCFFVFAFTYGNALYDQKTYTEFRIEEVIDSIKAPDTGLFTGEEPVILQIKGDIGHAPVLGGTISRFPILDRLVPRTFGDYSWVTYYGFARYYRLPELAWSGDDSFDLSTFHLPLIDETIYHTVYGNEHFLLIELK